MSRKASIYLLFITIKTMVPLIEKHSAEKPEKNVLRGIYAIGILSTAIGIAVVMILNMATPLAYILNLFEPGHQGSLLHVARLIGRRFGGLVFLIVMSGCFLCLLLYQMLKPLADCLKSDRSLEQLDSKMVIASRKRLINLPFYMIPANIILWLLLPALLFGAAYLTGRIDGLSAATLAIRSCMVGFIASGIMSFWLESYIRHRMIPFFFPTGHIADVKGVATLSISRRIRVFYRLGSLVPLAILIITLLTLQWQVGSMEISARDYGRGILVFSLVLFAIFFLGSSALNKLISRSISNPIGSILSSIKEVKSGNYDTRIAVVGNDEIGILGDATNEMIQGLAEKALLSEAFGKYVEPQIRDEILSGRIPLDGELKDVTVLFADIRDFTPMTAINDPKRVVRLLNTYFSVMAGKIQEHGGLILQFLGDEIYAVFGAPIPKTDHPNRAFRTALAMQKALAELNRTFDAQQYPRLYHGIGIHSGPAVAATIGSPERLSYLLVGDTVNLASRLQSLTRQMNAEIVFSAATHAHLSLEEKRMAPIKRHPSVTVKGRKQAIDVYSVCGVS